MAESKWHDLERMKRLIFSAAQLVQEHPELDDATLRLIETDLARANCIAVSVLMKREMDREDAAKAAKEGR